jgi:hypothetical protein
MEIYPGASASYTQVARRPLDKPNNQLIDIIEVTGEIFDFT